MPKPQPAAKFRLGYVTATVWKNDDFFNTVLSKSCRTATSGRTPTTSSTPATFLNAAELLERAEQSISEQ
jgi:hypothetical protein